MVKGSSSGQRQCFLYTKRSDHLAGYGESAFIGLRITGAKKALKVVRSDEVPGTTVAGAGLTAGLTALHFMAHLSGFMDYEVVMGLSM